MSDSTIRDRYGRTDIVRREVVFRSYVAESKEPYFEQKVEFEPEGFGMAFERQLEGSEVSLTFKGIEKPATESVVGLLKE